MVKVAFMLLLGRVKKDTFLQERGEGRIPQKEEQHVPQEQNWGQTSGNETNQKLLLFHKQRITNNDKSSSRT